MEFAAYNIRVDGECLVVWEMGGSIERRSEGVRSLILR